MNALRFHRVAACGLILSVLPSVAMAFRSGPPAGFNGSTGSSGSSCQQCHGAAAGSGSVQILGFPANYAPSTIYDLTVRIADATKLGAGFQISVEDASGEHVGLLSLLNATHTQLNGGWVNHTSTGVNNAVANWGANSNSASYMVRWTSPATNEGTLTAWAAGNAINNDFNSTGDTIYLTSVSSTFGQDVPTVSQWGVGVVALLLLTAGTLLLRFQRPVAVRIQ